MSTTAVDAQEASIISHYKMKGVIAPTTSIDAEELERSYVARFKNLTDDQEVFADIKQPGGQRRHFHVISENNHIGPAKITKRHHFHMSYLEVPPGSAAILHAHDAPEVFIPMTGHFVIQYGDDGKQEVALEPMDVISVPVGLMRTFKNVGNVNGILMVIYDGPGNVLDKIFMHQEFADELVATKPELARDLGLA